ncbi:hypothetical protein BBJ28_00006285 [Nothophytophthora sp. Chile5]|nr:hypothetical protein BBJ28_00006285 [Nothophytophthora sp. Chile5]
MPSAPPHKPARRTALKLRGFHADRFLLTAAHAALLSPSSGDADTVSSSTPPKLLERDFADLQTWDRLLRRQQGRSDALQRLPTRRLRKLMAFNWERDDGSAGWRIELQKNVVACETWVNDAFVLLPTHLQHAFLDDGLYVAAKQEQAASRAEVKHARDLQQYFTSQPLVELVLARVLAFLQLKDQDNVVWLEPSCGDGRFVTALLRAGARHVVGYEIDEHLHGVASEKAREAVAKDAIGAADSSLQICLGDFLESTSSASTNQIVIAVGNPPFGARGGDGSDLVHRFFQHAALEWHASVIAFIVPERCSKPAFVETTLLQLAGAGSWRLATEEPLTGHEFEFGAGGKLKSVKQPSVLQLFARTSILDGKA